MNMLATERLPEPCQLRGSGTFLVRRRVVHVPDDVQDGASGEERRRFVGVVVAPDPVVVVADTVQRLDVVAPDGLEAHPLAGRMQVRLERENLDVLAQHGIRVKLLVWFVRIDVDVDAVPQRNRCPPEFRFETLRGELEADLEMRLRVAPVGVEVNGIRHEAGTRFQQPRGVEAEEVGVPADLVDRPRGGARVQCGHNRIVFRAPCGVSTRVPQIM